MHIRKITIAQLSQGMFIHELDIPWIKSPFLRHRRKIKSASDIALLKQAGVEHLLIDLSKGADVAAVQTNTEALPAEQAAVSITSVDDDNSAAAPIENKASLHEELQVATELQHKIGQLVNRFSQLVRNGQPLSADSITPIIQQSIASINRNDQAMLSLLHLHRKDLKLNDHSFAVFALIIPLAIHLSCTADEINELATAALLHDVGWARLPMHLFDKTKPYSSAEKKLVQQHISIIENILHKNNDFSDNIKQIIVQHHDSSTFAEKTAGSVVHRQAEILQLADLYDELIHGLMGQQGMLPASALKRLYYLAKKGLYSETIVSKLIHVLGIYPLTSAVLLSTGEKARVVEIDKQKPLLPRVIIVYHADGQPCLPPRVMDLAEQNNTVPVKISKVIDPIDKNNDPHELLLTDTIDGYNL